MVLLIAPAALILVLFQVVPIVIGANASFRDWALYDPKKTWVGLAHYVAVLTDRSFLTIVLPNTFATLEAAGILREFSGRSGVLGSDVVYVPDPSAPLADSARNVSSRRSVRSIPRRGSRASTATRREPRMRSPTCANASRTASSTSSSAHRCSPKAMTSRG